MKKTIAVLALVFAIITSILSLAVFVSDEGRYTSHETYGGDAYTGIQNAAADTAVNIMLLNEVVHVGFGGILLVGAFAFFLVSVRYFQLAKEEIASVQSKQVAAPTVSSRFCTVCGASISANVNHCTNCGTAVTTPQHFASVPDGWKCTSCSRMNPQYQTTCSCGARKPY